MLFPILFLLFWLFKFILFSLLLLLPLLKLLKLLLLLLFWFILGLFLLLLANKLFGISNILFCWIIFIFWLSFWFFILFWFISFILFPIGLLLLARLLLFCIGFSEKGKLLFILFWFWFKLSFDSILFCCCESFWFCIFIGSILFELFIWLFISWLFGSPWLIKRSLSNISSLFWEAKLLFCEELFFASNSLCKAFSLWMSSAV